MFQYHCDIWVPHLDTADIHMTLQEVDKSQAEEKLEPNVAHTPSSWQTDPY